MHVSDEGIFESQKCIPQKILLVSEVLWNSNLVNTLMSTCAIGHLCDYRRKLRSAFLAPSKWEGLA